MHLVGAGKPFAPSAPLTQVWWKKHHPDPNLIHQAHRLSGLSSQKLMPERQLISHVWREACVNTTKSAQVRIWNKSAYAQPCSETAKGRNYR